MNYFRLTKAELETEKSKILEEYNNIKVKGLSLDLSRGKPGKAQLDLLEGMLGCVSTSGDCKSESGIDCRNYGVLDGIPEAKDFSPTCSEFRKKYNNRGNSSLNLMYDTVARAMLYGTGRRHSLVQTG